MKTYTQTSIGKDALKILQKMALEDDRSMRKLLDKLIKDEDKRRELIKETNGQVLEKEENCFGKDREFRNVAKGIKYSNFKKETNDNLWNKNNPLWYWFGVHNKK